MGTYLRKDRIISKHLISETYKHLVEKYGRSNIQQLTPASPFVQTLNVIGEISELNFLYIENAISELNIATAKNLDNVYGLSRLTGHNPSRGLASRGKVKITLKVNYEDFNGNYLLIPKYTKILCLNNNFTYSLVPETNNIKIEKEGVKSVECNIIEGEPETQVFISRGDKLQSFSVMVNKLTDHYNVSVSVNGEIYRNVESLYDMLPDEKAVIVKTGINGGLDLYFGNGSFGKIPDQGNEIEVTYIKTNGSAGNIATMNTKVYYKFEDTAFNIFGEELDLNNICDISSIMNPAFGSNEEDLNFTRMIAPKMSKSFVLVNPENYYYFFKKYNYFSVINIYNTVDDIYPQDDNIIYAFLVPDLRKKMNTEIDYFSINEQEFILSEQERNMIRRLINESGQQLIGSELKFVTPQIKHYVLNIVLTFYKTFSKELIALEIRKKLNEYFLNVNRRDIIPRADLITIIKTIEGVDSVNVYFISEENESAIRNGYYTKRVFVYNKTTQEREWTDTKKITLKDGEDPNLGLNEFGDIEIGNGEIPIIRGGWRDRNDVYYSDNLMDNISALNVFFKDSVEYNLYMKENRKAFMKIQEIDSL